MSAESGTLADYFVPRKQAGEPGLPVLSVTMNNGLVLRNSLDRRTESAMLETAHALVEPGDIAYNMMRMWQGASGLCRIRANISPAYVVMTPKANTDPAFAAHWLKSKDAIDLLWAYSHGLTEDRLRLYPDDFLTIPANFPPLPEQRRVAAVLDAWDAAIATAERLREQKEIRDKLRWRSLIMTMSTCELGDVVKVVMGQSPPSSSYVDLSTPGAVALIQGAADFGNGHFVSPQVATTAPTKTITQPSVIMSVRAPVGSVSLSDGLYCLGRGVCALTPADPMLVELIAHCVEGMTRHWSVVSQGGTFEAVSGEEIRQAPVVYPGPQQIEAVSGLVRSIRQAKRDAEMQLSALRQQKRGLMQQLLTGKLRVPETIDRLLPPTPPVLEAAA